MKANSDSRPMTGQHAEFLARDREDEIGMRVGQDGLHDALARPAAEHAAGAEGIQRVVDLIGVVVGRAEEAVDALRDVVEGEIGADHADNAHARAGHHPAERQSGEEELRPGTRP